MAEGEFRLPHELPDLSERCMPDLASSENREMLQDVPIQSSEEATPREERISSAHVGEAESEVVGSDQETEMVSSPDKESTENLDTPTKSNNNVEGVAKKHPWTLHRERKERELMERMGKPPEVVQQWICKQCGMETGSAPLLELHIKAAHDNPLPELKCRKCEFR